MNNLLIFTCNEPNDINLWARHFLFLGSFPFPLKMHVLFLLGSFLWLVSKEEQDDPHNNWVGTDNDTKTMATISGGGGDVQRKGDEV